MKTNGLVDDIAIGVDLGGTHMRAALVRRDGSMQKVERAALDKRDPESLLTKLAGLHKILNPDGKPIPMGVGLAAQIWVATGHVAVAPNLGWRDVAFGKMLTERFKCKVRLINDLNAITVGEAVCGAGEGASDVICIFVGTGLGMGAVSHGRIIEGADGLATELGHIKVASPVDGRLCGCGSRGCLEAYTSGRHLPELLQEKVKQGIKTQLIAEVQGDLTKIGADRLEHAAAIGDQGALAVWSDVSNLLGHAIADLVVLFNPRVVILGGGVLEYAPVLKQKVVRYVQETLASPYKERTFIRNSRLGDAAGVIGSGLMALET